MTEKHLKKQYWVNTLEGFIYINDGENHMSWVDVVDTLNSLKEENEQLKKELDQFYLLIGRGDWSGLVDLIKGDWE